MLENIGAQLILSGVSSFVSGANQASSAINNFQGRLDSAGTNVKNFGTNVTNAGNFMQRTGFILSFQLTAPLIALGKTVFSASTDFETAFTNVRKNVSDAAERDFPILEQALRDMSKQTGVSAIDLATIAGEAGQVGISAKNIIPFTETIAKLRVATNLGAEATQELARIATLTGTTDFPALGNAITLVGANTNATEKEIVHMAAGLAGTARVIGLGTADVIGLAAGFSSLGIQAEAGRGSFQKLGFAISTAVTENGKDLEIWAKVANQTTDEFATSFRTKPIEAILAVIQGFGEIREEGVLVKDKVFDAIGLSASEFAVMLKTDAAGAVALYEQGLEQVGGEGTDLNKVLTALGLNEIRIKDLLLRSASAHGDVTKAVRDSNKEYTSGNATQIEFEKKLKSTQGQLDVLKAKLIDAAIDVGKLITPDVLAAAETFTQAIVAIAKEFSKLDPQTRKNILLFAAVAAALAPIIVVLGALLSVVGLVAQGVGLFGRGIAFLLPYLPKLLAETSGLVSKFGVFFSAVVNAARAAGILATAKFLLATAISRVGLALRGLLSPLGLVGLALTGLMLVMDHTGTSFDDLKNLMLKVGSLLLAGLILATTHIAATFNDMQAAVLSAVANIARAIANLLAQVPGVGNALQQGVANIAATLETSASKYRKASMDAKIAGKEWSESVILAANATMTFGKAVTGASTAAAQSGEDFSTMDDAVAGVVETTKKAPPPIRNFGNLLGDDEGVGKKAKEAEESVLSAAEAFEQFLNSLSTEELAAYAVQTDINRIAQDAWLAGLHKELQQGNIVHVAEQFQLAGKTAKEAFDFITEGLKKVQEEGPRTSDEIVRMAKETRLFDDQWKFFESDAKRMIQEGLIDQVAAQLIGMGKTGKEAIEFINQTFVKLQEEAKKTKEELDELSKAHFLNEQTHQALGNILAYESARYREDLKKEIDLLEKEREKLRRIEIAKAATAKIGREDEREDRRSQGKVALSFIARVNESLTSGLALPDILRSATSYLQRIEDMPLADPAIRHSLEDLIDIIKDAMDAGLSRVPGFQHGGIVAGAPSKSMLAQVHGSETIIPASLRNMEFSLVNRLAGMLGNLGNQFTVNANYSNSQSPASISLDMSALMAMARN